MPNPGQLFPNFELPNQDGNPVRDAEAVRTAVRDRIDARVDAPRRGAQTPRPEGEMTPLRARLEVSKPVLSGAEGERAVPPRFALDYISDSDEQTLEALDIIDRPALVLLAARLGPTRLIDNTIVVPKGISVADDLRGLMDADAARLPWPLTTHH